MHRLIQFVFVLLIVFNTQVSASTGKVVFLREPPAECQPAGQVVGTIDKKIYDEWDRRKDPVYAPISPEFMNNMKAQALKMQANAIVFTGLEVDYVHKSHPRQGAWDVLQNGTYTGMAYRCNL